MPEIINLYILWISEDRSSWTDADNLIKQCTDILSSTDLDEIDLFKFKFYMEVIPYKLYLVTQQYSKDYDLVNTAIEQYTEKLQAAEDSAAEASGAAEEAAALKAQ